MERCAILRPSLSSPVVLPMLRFHFFIFIPITTAFYDIDEDNRTPHVCIPYITKMLFHRSHCVTHSLMEPRYTVH